MDNSTVTEMIVHTTEENEISSFTTGSGIFLSVPGSGEMSWDDATWTLPSSFIIFTMQSGFGLFEAGAVSHKNEVNILVKNAVDVLFGSISYWAFGFALSFGNEPGSNPICGVGYFFLNSTDEHMGLVFSTFVFQLSFATTATTIVSGVMAERTRLTAYIMFSSFNTIVFCLPAHWMWADNGFLRTLGAVDIAGSAVVHLMGGVSAFVGSIILKPRIGRFDNGTETSQLGNPVSSLIGMFMSWWGWLAFNCGSTFGISGGKWKLAAKYAITTLNGFIGGGLVGTLISYVVDKKYHINIIINSILAALVSVTGGCAIMRPWEALIIGMIGGLLSVSAQRGLDKLKIDDHAGAAAVHGVGGIWGMLAVGLVADVDPIEDKTFGRSGLFRSGDIHLLGVQILAIVCIAVWSGLASCLIILTINLTIGLRFSPEEEVLSADYVKHMLDCDGPMTLPLEEINGKETTQFETCVVQNEITVSATVPCADMG